MLIISVIFIFYAQNTALLCFNLNFHYFFDGQKVIHQIKNIKKQSLKLALQILKTQKVSKNVNQLLLRSKNKNSYH